MLEKWFHFVSLSGRENTIREFFKIAEPFNYALVGGWGVGLFVDGRLPTFEDLDILLYPYDLENFKSHLNDSDFVVGGLGGYGISTVKVVKEGFCFDILLAYNSWEEEALDNFIYLNWDDIKVKIVYPEFIVIMKIFAGRNKDLLDIILVLESGKIRLERLKEIVLDNLGYDIWEDLKQLSIIGKDLLNKS
ncbi:MAG: hypothetical protein N2202_01570 [Proteobacteria bacterium]|nr:hypothetical protein [Pseudomonadota bacterium]